MEKSHQYEIIDRTYAEAVKGLISDQSILNHFERWTNYYLDLPRKEQVTYTITLFDWQVKNGGFHQYFFNSYGIFCFYTIDNLKEIKCIKQGDLLEKAISIIYDHTDQRELFLRNLFHRKVDLINSFDEVIFEAFRPLEDEYYQIEENNDTNNKLVIYLME
jgi:hypothetical protein